MSAPTFAHRMLIDERPNTEPRQKQSAVVLVVGTPIPQGSKWAFINKRTGKPVMLDENSKALRAWRRAVKTEAQNVVEREQLRVPLEVVAVRMLFCFNRPRSLPKRIRHKTTRPDLDKLVRAVLDALTGVLFNDDNRVIALSASKQYDDGDERLMLWIDEL